VRLNKRFLVLLLLTLAIAFGFWSTSRYPDLTIKGTAAPNLVLDGLGFDVVYPVHPNDPLYVKVGKRTINWLDTNKKGMAFGLVMAAALGAALSAVTRKGFGGLFPNTALGVALGAPMGLCVNCAAPIGAGMHRSGSRLETTMALVLASPTLNVIVISILFTMLPFHLALLKIVFTVILLLLAVPLIARALPDDQPKQSPCCADPVEAVNEADVDTWVQATVWSVRQFFSNLWTLSLSLVPLMVLAGALGSFLVSLFPFGVLASLSNTVNPLTLILVALVGTFLPVPMSFDVIVCGLLYHSGVPVPYVMVLLFTLGSYSVYTFAVFRKAVSARAASVLFLTVAAFGILAGYLGDRVDDFYRDSIDQRLKAVLQSELSKPATTELEGRIPIGSSYSQLKMSRKLQPRDWETFLETDDLLVERHPLAPVSQSTSDSLFEMRPAEEIGLETPVVLSYQEQLSIPMLTNRSIASGDVHQDGWVDLVVANDTEIGGVSLFANINGVFHRQKLNLGGHDRSFVTVLSLVDWNGDGSLDLFFSTVLGFNGVVLNDQGEFKSLIPLPSTEGAFVNAVGFADLDNDGDMDAVLGTWVHHFMTSQAHRARNYVLRQGPDQTHSIEPLPGKGGNSNSVLLSDLNNDTYLDLVIANDFAPPDEFYWGGPDGFEGPVGPRIIPSCPEWTMSLDSADLNSNGLLEMLALNISFPTDARGRLVQARTQKPEELLEARPLEAFRYLAQARELHDRARLLQDPHDGLEGDFLDPRDQRSYLYDVLLARVWRSDDREEWLRFVPEEDTLARSHFDRVFPPPAQPTDTSSPDYEPLTGQREHSSLFSWQEDRFEDLASQWNLTTTYWSWNGRFQDFDLDGFQDLYVVTGTFQEKLLTPNLLYLGKGGRTFQRLESGRIADHTPTACATYLDVDNDGDFDVITSPANSPLRFFENTQHQNRTLLLSLQDLAGQRSALGSRALVSAGQQQQMLELKQSGGYASFNPPLLSFGLGDNQKVERLEVRWSHGGHSLVEEALESGYHYRIVRRVPSE
jgi:uncharacterized membrane protein YraQ (UPF0718 family)